MKKTFITAFIVFVLTMVVVGYIEINKTVIKSDKVYGYGNNNNETYYIISVEQAYIPSTLEQIQSLSDDTYVNINYLVIYNEKKWFWNKREVIRIMRFERPLPDYEYEDIDTYYYRLVEENIESIDDKHTVFIRLYEKYDGNHNLWSLEPKSIIISNVNSVAEGKQQIKEIDASFLKLLPKTIVDETLINEWEIDKYDATHDYTVESPKQLTIDGIIKSGHN